MNKLHSFLNRFRNLIKNAFGLNYDPKETDITSVVVSSRLLQVSEFRFFLLAYSQWYGRDISEKNLEPIFSDYMLKDRVPHWVRHFSRKVLSLHSIGVLDPGEYGIKCIISPYKSKNNSPLLPIIMAFVYLIFFLIFSGKITLL